MPRKIRELIRDLEQAGFVNRGGRGDHRNFQHPHGIRVGLSGNPGEDAKPYQEKQVRGVAVVKDSARYVKLIEWSEEDQSFVGQCPGVIGPCCHGDDETAVYAELCQIVDEWIEIFKKDGDPLPPPTAGLGLAERILTEVGRMAPEPRPSI
jgi:predicted RNA binding protein YcfA (HicA-like mRNA interferase family)/predicted RNase H-like HicB family nuclease